MSKRELPKRKPNAKPSAKRKIMDILARGSRSVDELRRKLSQSDYTSDEIDEAIEAAQTNNWLTAPEELSEQLTQSLTRKKKSAYFIEQYLLDKGLPAPEVDPMAEFQKALDVVQGKLSKASGFNDDEKQKICRLLANRGFDSDTIQKIIDKK